MTVRPQGFLGSFLNSLWMFYVCKRKMDRPSHIQPPTTHPVNVTEYLLCARPCVGAGARDE